jgi:DNA-directed RNA polymerase specialized sigma24 family protein
MTDDDLARLHVRIIAGDPDAYAAFEVAIRPLALGLLRARGVNEADADEAWNTAFLVVIHQARSITPLGVGLRQFALGVVYRKGIDAIRRAKSRKEVPIDGQAGNPYSRVGPVDAAKAQRVHDCVAAARPIYAAVMEMTAQGLTAAEIALILGKSDGSVDKLRLRARAWFAQCLGDLLDE